MRIFFKENKSGLFHHKKSPHADSRYKLEKYQFFYNCCNIAIRLFANPLGFLIVALRIYYLGFDSEKITWTPVFDKNYCFNLKIFILIFCGNYWQDLVMASVSAVDP
jgi:hypothetical protein